MENFEAGQSHGQETAPEAPNKPRFWKFAAWFVGIVVIVLAAASLASYVSPEARRDRELQRNYLQYQKGMSEFEAAMRADTYGGKTPQETLDMFVDALKKGDVELASKYFALNGPLSRGEWKTEIEKRKEEIIGVAIRAVPTPKQEKSETTFWFSVYDQQNKETQQLIEMSFNSSAGVWKIESL